MPIPLRFLQEQQPPHLWGTLMAPLPLPPAPRAWHRTDFAATGHITDQSMESIIPHSVAAVVLLWPQHVQQPQRRPVGRTPGQLHHHRLPYPFGYCPGLYEGIFHNLNISVMRVMNLLLNNLTSFSGVFAYSRIVDQELNIHAWVKKQPFSQSFQRKTEYHGVLT
jgi:hypothetical protein